MAAEDDLMQRAAQRNWSSLAGVRQMTEYEVGYAYPMLLANGVIDQNTQAAWTRAHQELLREVGLIEQGTDRWTQLNSRLAAHIAQERKVMKWRP